MLGLCDEWMMVVNVDYSDQACTHIIKSYLKTLSLILGAAIVLYKRSVIVQTNRFLTRQGNIGAN